MEEAKKEITGKLTAYWEQGMEGLAWALEKDNPTGKTLTDVLHFMATGDILTVFADAAAQTVLWQGTVDLDSGMKAIEVTSTSDCGPPITRLLYGYGFQRDMAIKWADMFLREYRAEVIPATPQP